MPESSKKNSVLGLYLLYLLSQNKISEFHVELQSIPSSEHGNIYINVPVSLEQYFVDGNYSKVLATKKAPLEAYNFFIEKFIDTVRTEIARSAEVSYKQLSLKDACEVFMIDNVDQLRAFVEHEANYNEGTSFRFQRLDNDRYRDGRVIFSIMGSRRRLSQVHFNKVGEGVHSSQKDHVPGS